MADLLLALRPERWKVLQVLPMGGQNDGKVESLLIDELTFAATALGISESSMPGSAWCPKTTRT